MNRNKNTRLIYKFIFSIFFVLLTSISLAQEEPPMPTITINAVESSLPIILSILAEESGYNIVTGPSVNSEEKLTIQLNDVPINQAIDLIVRAAGLSYEIVGNSILIAEEVKLSTDVGVASHVIELKYANAEDVASLLLNITDQITVDKSGNNLLVSVSPKKLDDINAIISQIDKPAIQIMLEAKLIEISLSDEDKMGLDWAKLSSLTTILAESGSPVSLSGGGNTGSLMPGSSFETSSDGGVVESLTPQTTGQLPSEMYFQRLNGDGLKFSRQLSAFDLTLDFLLKNNKAEILANSQVVTLNGHKATISMVDIVPYILSSGGLGGQVQVQREEIGIKLDILPTVNTDGYITTSVTPEVSSIFEFIGPDRNIPWVKKRLSTTTIRVKDEESIIIAGLITLDKKFVTHKFPLLHRIPFFGPKFFTHRSEVETKTDLVVQITPKIVRDNYTGIEKNSLHMKTEESSLYRDRGTEVDYLDAIETKGNNSDSPENQKEIKSSSENTKTSTDKAETKKEEVVKETPQEPIVKEKIIIIQACQDHEPCPNGTLWVDWPVCECKENEDVRKKIVVKSYPLIGVNPKTKIQENYRVDKDGNKIFKSDEEQ